MSVIVVASPKGGVGKSTLSTQIAGYFASTGRPTLLGDVDRQQSSRTWLSLRPDGLARIDPWEVDPEELGAKPKPSVRAVLDTPAGLSGRALDEAIRIADKILVPLQPSIFDIHATHDFVARLLAHRRAARLRIALVGMRTREGGLSTDQLHEFIRTLDVELVGFLRDTQNYVHLAAHGLTLWDVGGARFERDLEQWQPVTEWLDA